MQKSSNNEDCVPDDEEVKALWDDIHELRARLEQKLIVFLARPDIPDEIKEMFKR